MVPLCCRAVQSTILFYLQWEGEVAILTRPQGTTSLQGRYEEMYKAQNIYTHANGSHDCRHHYRQDHIFIDTRRAEKKIFVAR